MQHFDLSNILLTIHNPRTPRLGSGQKLAIARIEVRCWTICNKPAKLITSKRDVITTLRRLCGVAISNRLAPPAMNTACAAIALCKCFYTRMTVPGSGTLTLISRRWRVIRGSTARTGSHTGYAQVLGYETCLANDRHPRAA